MSQNLPYSLNSFSTLILSMNFYAIPKVLILPWFVKVNSTLFLKYKYFSTILQASHFLPYSYVTHIFYLILVIAFYLILSTQFRHPVFNCASKHQFTPFYSFNFRRGRVCWVQGGRVELRRDPL